MVMLDDSKAESCAVSTVYPAATTLLCTFHVLQACWRWLWNGNHHVALQDRPECYDFFKRLVYSRTPQEFEVKLVFLIAKIEHEHSLCDIPPSHAPAWTAE